MTTILDCATAIVGDRNHIHRDEMTAILLGLAAEGLQLDNGWGGPDAAGWADVCRGITVISVLADDDAPVARAMSSNPGSIRHDEPGSMHPQMHATLMFASEAACEREATLDYLVEHTERLLIVGDGVPAAPDYALL